MPQLISSIFALNPPVESRLFLDFLHLGDKLFRRWAHIRLTAPGGQGQPVRAKFLRLHVDALPAVEGRVALF